MKGRALHVEPEIHVMEQDDIVRLQLLCLREFKEFFLPLINELKVRFENEPEPSN